MCVVPCLVNLESMLRHVEELMSQKNYDDSLHQLDQILKEWPNLTSALQAKGVVLDLLGKHAAAVECFAEVIRVEPDSAPAHNGMGNAFNSLGLYADALGHFDTAIRLDPANPVFFYGRSCSLDALKRPREAYEMLKKVKSMGFNPPEIDDLMRQFKDELGDDA